MNTSGAGAAGRVRRSSARDVAPREGWIDVAKGIAIVLVVLFHAVLYLDMVGAAGPWGRVNNLLDTFRMPLFFVMSGMLAVGALSRRFGDLWWRRIAPLLYLYAVWSVLQILAGTVAGSPFAPAELPRALFLSAVDPHPNLWFIYALPLYLILHRLVRSWPVAVHFVLAALISLSAPILVGAGLASGWSKPLRYVIFFTLGVHGAALIRAFAVRATWRWALIAGAGYALIVAGPVRWWSSAVPAVQTLSGIAAVAAGITVAVCLDRTRAAGLVRRLGQRTLPIYLVHVFPLLAVAAFVRDRGGLSGAMAGVAPPLLAAVAIAFSLAFFAATRRVPGLFALPFTPRRREVPHGHEFPTGRASQT